MTTLLLGAGPRFDWLRGWLGTERDAAVRIGADPTRESLSALAAEQVDTLVLVDHHAFAAGPLANEASVIEAVRSESRRAVFALEVAQRAVQTVDLAKEPSEAWPSVLARITGLSLHSSVAPCPPVLLAPATEDNLLLRTYLQPLFGATKTSPLILTWPREAFLDGDAPGATLPAAIEIAGRARILAYGPYLPLPTGRWHATAYLAFSIDIEKMPFMLEVDTGSITRGFFEVERGGIFTVVLDFEVTDALHPIEMRLISQDSALEGQAALIEVHLEQSG